MTIKEVSEKYGIYWKCYAISNILVYCLTMLKPALLSIVCRIKQ